MPRSTEAKKKVWELLAPKLVGALLGAGRGHVRAGGGGVDMGGSCPSQHSTIFTQGAPEGDGRVALG